MCASVCEREVTGIDSTATQSVLFLCKTIAGRYIRESTDNVSKDASLRLNNIVLSLSDFPVIHPMFQTVS